MSNFADIDFDMLKENGVSEATIQALKELRSENEESGNEKVESASSNLVFGKQEYWEERFKTEEEYDWLVTFSQAKDCIVPFLKVDSNILVVGCGNSSFSNDLYDAGYHNIVNIDYSQVVIDKMHEANRAVRPLMQWICMDMTKITFDDKQFDIVIDKAAMDALMVNEGDVWYPDESVVRVSDEMCCGIRRILKDNGTFLQISFAQPHFRTKYLIGYRADQIEVSPYESHQGYSSRYQWDLSYSSIDVEGGCLNSFLYVMKCKQ